MFKKFLFAMSMVVCLFLAVSCKTDSNKEDTKEYPRFSDISILESVTKEGAIDVLVKAQDNDASIYLIVIKKDSKSPTNEEIKKHESYDGVEIVSYMEGTGTVYKTIEGLEEAKAYDLYVTLVKNNLYAKEFYKTTCVTKTLEEVIDKGSGTNEDPYKIFSLEDLELVASDASRLTAFYSLQNDLDLSVKYGKDKKSFVPLSWQTGSLKAFNGYFNGNGHTIKNLYINETKESIGLFGQVGEEGTVANLVLENPYVATTGQRLGAVVGYNKGSVINVSVIGGMVESLVPDGGQAKAGGIVGDMYESGSILRCVSKTTVVAKGTNVGGVVGSSDASTGKTQSLEIKNCYSLSDVKTNGKYTGGIVGYARCVVIENCYTLGTVEGGEGVGGIAGFLQQRNGSSIVPAVKNCFVLGTTVKVNGATQTNTSGLVVGNRSTSNNTNPTIENLYYADSTLTGNTKKPQGLGEEVDASVFKNKDWLKAYVNMECNDVYWTLKANASRPTLVHAKWDEGAYSSSLYIKDLKVAAPERNKISIEASCSKDATIYYVVVLSTAKAPTAEQIIAQKDYDGVILEQYGFSDAKTLKAEAQNLKDDTTYAIYAVAKSETEVSNVLSSTQKTLPAPILLETSYEVKDGTNLGELKILITTNKNVTTYYKVSKEKLNLTKDEMIAFDSVTSKTITINELDENTEYFIYLYSSTADEDVEIEEIFFTTKADPVAFEVAIDFSKTATAGQLELILTPNKDSATLWYLLSENLTKVYTKEEIMTSGILYTGDKVIFEQLKNNTEYKILVYGKTNTRETEVLTSVATTLDVNYEQFADYFVGDWNQPGIYEKNGSVHEMPSPISETGKTISVADFGATPKDNTFDNYEAFKAAIASAEAGDIIYIPNGTYFFTGHDIIDGYYAHIHLKSNLTLKGESKDGVILVSCFDETLNKDTGGKQTTVISVTNSVNVAIKNLTVSSNTGTLDYDNTNSNLTTDIFSGPKYGITVASKDPTQETKTRNVIIENVLIEKFRRSGVRIAMAEEVVIRKSTFQNATCLGGGGAGYGVCIQGQGHNLDGTDTVRDTKFNIVEECDFVGPYLRHGTLIQYYAHNNLVCNNTFRDTLLDAIDMHGEDEYSNEICHNQILNTRRGAGIGLGNTGAGHDATGRNNFIHDNTIDGGDRGIDIMLDTPNTVIFNNLIKNVKKGVSASRSNGTRIVNNTFEIISGNAIAVVYSQAWGNKELGIQDNFRITDNNFVSCNLGIYIEVKGDNFELEGNTFEGIGTDKQIIDETEAFVLPTGGLTAEIIADDENFEYTLKIMQDLEKLADKIYYTFSTTPEVPSEKDLLNELPTSDTEIKLEGLNPETKYYIHVLCSRDKNGKLEETSKIITLQFETAQTKEEPLNLTAKLTTNTADGVTAKYAQAGASFTVTEGATIHYVLTDTAIETPTIEVLNSDVSGTIVIKGATLETKNLFTGLTSETTYYLYCYASLDDRTTEVISKEVTTAAYRNFNRDLPTKGTINIYNAEDFYKYIEFENIGLILDDSGNLTKPSDSAKVTLFGDIYLSEKIDMIVDTFKGVFDGQGYTIYNMCIESDASQNLGLYKVITGSGANPGTFKNTNFVNASVKNTFAGTTDSNAGNGIVCCELRGIIENIIIRDSEILVSQEDSRLGAIAGRFTNYKDATYTAYVSNCAIYNTTVSGGSKNIGGAIGLAAYANPYTTSQVGTPIYVSDLYVQANIVTTGTQSSVGGVIGVSEILVRNVVSDVSIMANGKARKDALILGTIQNTTKETSKATISSCMSYQKGTLVRNWKNADVVSEKLYEVGTTNSDSTTPPKQDVIAIEEITETWIQENTTFDLENFWVLKENHLVLHLGGKK